MSTVTVYGADICVDCREFKKFAEIHQLDWEFIDITASVSNLREFLALRDNREEFDERKSQNRIGIPVFTCGDLITFNLEEALSFDNSDKDYKEIYLAGGCFWGSEKAMGLLKGVAATEVGYANSILENPTYEQVCTGGTNAAETVRVKYNPHVVSLDTVLEAFFMIIDPTQQNRQGADIGTQYRSGVYFTDPADEQVIRAYFDEEAKRHYGFCTELMPLSNFYPAEEYHQEYLYKNPLGYCHVPIKAFKEIKALNE